MHAFSKYVVNVFHDIALRGIEYTIHSFQIIL